MANEGKFNEDNTYRRMFAINDELVPLGAHFTEAVSGGDKIASFRRGPPPARLTGGKTTGPIFVSLGAVTARATLAAPMGATMDRDDSAAVETPGMVRV